MDERISTNGNKGSTAFHSWGDALVLNTNQKGENKSHFSTGLEPTFSILDIYRYMQKITTIIIINYLK